MGAIPDDLPRTRQQRDAARQVITDAQAILARYLPPESGISEHEVVNQLLELLDGPHARAALRD